LSLVAQVSCDILLKYGRYPADLRSFVAAATQLRRVVLTDMFRPPTAIRRPALVYGLYDLPSARQFDAGRLVVTMFRDPAARIRGAGRISGLYAASCDPPGE